MIQLDPSKAFLGVGWSAPPLLDGKGEIVMAAYEEDIRQAILIILGTSPGERVMRPDFGAGLRNLVFEPMNVATIALAQDTVERALSPSGSRGSTSRRSTSRSPATRPSPSSGSC